MVYQNVAQNPSTDNLVGSGSPNKKRKKTWFRVGLLILVLVIIAAVVGGVVGSHKSNNNAQSRISSSSSGSMSLSGAAASAAASAKVALGRFASATDSFYMVPVYPSTTDTAAFTVPTFVSTSDSVLSWPRDPFQPTSPTVLTTRPDRPRLFAPTYKWQALPTLIQNDPYLKGWNDTIFGNATAYYNLPPVVYHLDGDSGILDNAREIKMRIKAFAYVYRLTNDTKWVDRAWTEILNAAGNGTTPFGPDVDKWNSGHFLDTAEFSAAFGIAYDWFYDVWTDNQKAAIRQTLIQYGLSFGVTNFQTSAGWWTAVNGNWNCVCNGGLTIGSLAILGDDTSGTAEQLLGLTVANAKSNCANAVSNDGTWSETANYWYFGTTGHAEMSAALLTATGSDYGLLDVNTNFFRTGVYHMYVFGATSLFNYGDHGPNKFSTTANSLFLYASQFDQPQFNLFQREQADAAEPWSMFWYDPTVSGAFWDGAPLDQFFDNSTDQWASMRSSWTDQNALYTAIKAGSLQGHQTHNDLDVGDFVLDACSVRFAGELGSGDYLSTNYFSNDTQTSDRWKYYRKMTEGQNTIVVNKANQNVAAAPSVSHGTSNTTQGSSTVINMPSNSTAYWTTDMTSAYFDATSVKRGIRLLNARSQVLLQDEITASADVQWRMHTNATVTTSGTTASLALSGQTMTVTLLNPPSGATFTTSEAVRYTTDPAPPQPDQPNPGVTVLIVDLPAGTYTLEVLFTPQCLASGPANPPSVALANWSLTSHN